MTLSLVVVLGLVVGITAVHAVSVVTGSFSAQVEIVNGPAVSSYNVLYSKERNAIRVEFYDATVVDTRIAVIDLATRASNQWTVSKRQCSSVSLPTPAQLTEWDVLTQVVSGLAGSNAAAMNSTSVRRMPVTTLGVDGYKWPSRNNATTSDIKWFFSVNPPWVVQSAAASVVLAATISAPNAAAPVQRFDVNYGSFAYATLPSDGGIAFRALGTCNISQLETVSSTNKTTIAPVPALLPMPTLPPQFSALISTTMVESQLSFSVYESFNGATGNARLSLSLPTSGTSEQITSIVVNNAFQLAYQVQGTVDTKDGVMWQSMNADGTQKTRTLLASATGAQCQKSIFADALVGDVNDLFLVTQAGGPRYMGKATVRGIDANMWEATFPSYKISWFFAAANVIVNGESVAPLRMIISGRGQSPFFVHHPFLQRGAIVTEKMKPACKVGAVLASNPQCEKGEDLYTHIHDFIGFVPRVDADEFGVPTVCQTDTGSQINSFPSASNCPEGLSSGTVFVLCLLSALFTGITVGLVVYYRMKRKLIAVAGGELPPPVPS